MTHPVPSLVLLVLAALACAGCGGEEQPLPEQPAEQVRIDVSGLHTGPELYTALCTACHGASGAADGPGSQSLFPPARNFRSHKFRLISTDSGEPTPEDIDRAIRLGMPGTSMRAFAELSSPQRQRLVEEVLRFRREGIAERLRRALQSTGEEVVEAEVQQQVLARLAPGERPQVLLPRDDDRQAVNRGRAIYQRQGCQACHGVDGIGASGLRLRTDEGIPTRGRDLVYEPFKGGHSPESMFLRITLGMPGTPMPASRTLKPEDVADLIAYCQSLAIEPKRNLTNDQRRQVARGEAYLRAFPKGK